MSDKDSRSAERTEESQFRHEILPLWNGISAILKLVSFDTETGTAVYSSVCTTCERVTNDSCESQCARILIEEF